MRWDTWQKANASLPTSLGIINASGHTFTFLQGRAQFLGHRRCSRNDRWEAQKEGTVGGDLAEHLVRPSHILGIVAEAKLLEPVLSLVENSDAVSHSLFFQSDFTLN